LIVDACIDGGLWKSKFFKQSLQVDAFRDGLSKGHELGFAGALRHQCLFLGLPKNGRASKQSHVSIEDKSESRSSLEVPRYVLSTLEGSIGWTLAVTTCVNDGVRDVWAALHGWKEECSNEFLEGSWIKGLAPFAVDASGWHRNIGRALIFPVPVLHDRFDTFFCTQSNMSST